MSAHFSEYRRLETLRRIWSFFIPVSPWRAGFLFYRTFLRVRRCRKEYMGDFFDEKKDETVEELEKIKVGEKEYSQDELSSLVGLGETAHELETKWNTKIDSLYPDYTRSRQELKTLREEKEAWTKAQEQKQVIPEDEQLRQARLAAKKVGIVTSDDFDSLLDKSFEAKYARQRAAEKLIEQAEDLEGKYNGQDGRPKFDKQDIFGFMQQNGISNPEVAYKIKFENELDGWKESQLKGAKRTGFSSINAAGGSKVPKEVKVTKDNLDALVAESLGGGRDE